MAVQDFWLRMLTVQTIEIAVNGLGVAAFRLKLNREMLDAEFCRDPVPDRLQQVAGQGLVISVDLHMRRHHDEAWFDRPNVQVVDILHAGNGFDGGRDLGGADARRSRFQ